MQPRARRRAERQLTVREREEISRGVVAEEGVRAIARRLGCAPSTVSRELARHGGRALYSASRAEARAWDRARRPKPCRLARCPRLRRVVEQKLRANWSPEQIAQWLQRAYPYDATMHVSHETIYQALYVQALYVQRSMSKRSMSKRAAPCSGRSWRTSAAGAGIAGLGRRPARRGAPGNSSTSYASPSDRPALTPERCPGTGKAVCSWASAARRS